MSSKLCYIAKKFVERLLPVDGGFWENAIKSAKYHLIKAVRNRACTLEQYTTLFAHIEAGMNSRLLYPIKEGAVDLTLTPHFSIGTQML